MLGRKRPRGLVLRATGKRTPPKMCGPPPHWLGSRTGSRTLRKQLGAMDALDPEPLLRFLHEQGIEHILIGGVAVAAHGYRRPSKDLDIVPAPLLGTWRAWPAP